VHRVQGTAGRDGVGCRVGRQAPGGTHLSGLASCARGAVARTAAARVGGPLQPPSSPFAVVWTVVCVDGVAAAAAASPSRCAPCAFLHPQGTCTNPRRIRRITIAVSDRVCPGVAAVLGFSASVATRGRIRNASHPFLVLIFWFAYASWAQTYDSVAELCLLAKTFRAWRMEHRVRLGFSLLAKRRTLHALGIHAARNRRLKKAAARAPYLRTFHLVRFSLSLAPQVACVWFCA